MVLKCKICGGDLSFQPGERIATCEYCGRKQTLPNIKDDDKIAVLYERANSYRLANEFDKAAHIYNQIIAEDKRDCEAYWNLVLCNYGVVYVQDPKTHQYVPTCNRAQYLSIHNNEDYKRALQYATEEQRFLYEKDAIYIDNVQKNIINIAKNEKPFDIFICYKETGIDGRRSKDSIRAQQLYDQLTSLGYKVFFSRITLESKIGTEYEPYIYAALASSRVMIHITSSRENTDAVWVRNEWSRYLSLAAKDTNKTLIPIYFNMSKEDLPEEFAHIPSYDMHKEGFEQELIRGVKKLIPTPIMKLQHRKKQKKVIISASAVFAVCITVGLVFGVPRIMEQSQYDTAMKLYQDGDYTEAAKEFESLDTFGNSGNMKKFSEAMQLYSEQRYAEAAWKFDELDSFNDSEEMKVTAEKSWRNSLATVAVTDVLRPVLDEREESKGSYYITSNGTVNTLNNDLGAAANGIDINEHGKVLSLGEADPLYALREDGFVTNAKENNQLLDDTEWHDIIKISSLINSTNIALRADGTMAYGDIQFEDSAIKELDSWSNIVDFDIWSLRYYFPNISETTAIIGVKIDGSLCAEMFYALSNWDVPNPLITEDYLQDIIQQFSNVKKVQVRLIPSDSDYSNGGERAIEIMALTYDGKIQMFRDGEFSELEISGVCDISLAVDLEYFFDGSLDTNWLDHSAFYLLKNNGDLVAFDEPDITLISDVAYVEKNTVVTQTGSIYLIENGNITATDAKTTVHDEWIERFN